MAASNRFTILIAFGTVALLVAASTTHGQNGMSIAFHAFQDSRGVTVLTPDMAVDRDFSDRTAVRLKFGVDAITAASDSCVRCHQEGAHNLRITGALSLVRRLGKTTVAIGGELGQEKFYSATTALTSVTRELNGGNTTVAGGFSYSLNRPQLHPSETVETQHSIDAFGSITQSWTKTTVTQFGYEVNHVAGYQTDPFLRASVNGVLTVGQSPDLRTRQALTARLRQALPGQTFLEADFRHYFDSWSVGSNALSLGLSHHFGDRVLANGSYRFYDQTGAFFYAPQYIGSPQYFTADFRLFPFNSDLYGGRVEIAPTRPFMNLPAGTTVTLQYERYLATTNFQAGIFSGGLHIPLP